MPSCRVKFAVISMPFDADITIRVNEEFLWGVKLRKCRPSFLVDIFVFRLTIKVSYKNAVTMDFIPRPKLPFSLSFAKILAVGR